MNINLHQAQSHDILRSWQSRRNDINHHKDFVLPMFIGNNDDAIESIDSMPGVHRYGCNTAMEYLEPLVYSGLRSVLLFPVITRSDRVKLDAEDVSDDDHVDGDDEEEEDGEDTSTGSNSSASQYSSPSLTSNSSEVEQSGTYVLSEILIPLDDANATTSNSQNPFLNQNEGEEDHLLAGEQGEGAEMQASSKNSFSIAPAPPPRANETVKKISKSQDIKLIKGLALKDKYNPVMRLIPKLRDKFPKLLIICDVCLCAFTSTGHCCLFEDHCRAKNGVATTTFIDNNSNSNIKITQLTNYFPISNNMTCQYLALLAVEYALRGCNVVAPSDMMDGRILTIREKLNDNRLHHVSIMSYSAKFASAFYGPFRQATNNAPEFGDRRAYQLPPGSRALALKAVRRDIDQGADFVMVKPAGVYLDIVRDIRDTHPMVPIAVYQVSGEYSMLKVAAEEGVIDLKQAVSETLTAYRRAGATIIISYFTPELLRGELLTSDI